MYIDYMVKIGVALFATFGIISLILETFPSRKLEALGKLCVALALVGACMIVFWVVAVIWTGG